MGSTKHFIFALLLALAAPACTASIANDTMEEGEVDDDGTKEDGVTRPAGHYTFQGRAAVGTITDLVLNEDKTFTYSWSTFGNGRSLHSEEVTGTYRFTKSGNNRFIRFINDDGDLVNRYQYRLSGTTLRLKVDWSSTWFEMAFQAASSEITGVRLPLLLDTPNHPFVESRNADLRRAGVEEFPRFVFGNADDMSQVDHWFQIALDENFEDTITNFFHTASPSDYSVADLGEAKGMCYTGNGADVAETVQALGDRVFTEMLQVYAWKFQGQTHYSQDLGEDDHQFVDEGLEGDEAWENYDAHSDDVVVSTTTGDGGDDFTGVRIPRCQ